MRTYPVHLNDLRLLHLPWQKRALSMSIARDIPSMQDSSLTSGNTSQFEGPLTCTKLSAKMFLCWAALMPSQTSLSYDTTQFFELLDEAVGEVDTIFIHLKRLSTDSFSAS